MCPRHPPPTRAPRHRRRPTSDPQRTCIGCRDVRSAARLVRFRWARDGQEDAGQLAVGPGPGRGAWLCGDHPVECLDLALRRRAPARALRREISGGDLLALRAKLITSTSEK